MKLSDRQIKTIQPKSNQTNTTQTKAMQAHARQCNSRQNNATQGKSKQVKTRQCKTNQLKMVNFNEEKIRRKYEKLGYKVLHKGCPDFLVFKYDEKTKKFSDVQFIEVKFGGDRLSYEQAVYKKVLKSLRLNYKLIHIPSLKEDQTKQLKSNQNNSIRYKTIQSKSTQNNTSQFKSNQNNSKQLKPIQPKTRQIKSTQLNTKEVKQNGTKSKT